MDVKSVVLLAVVGLIAVDSKWFKSKFRLASKSRTTPTAETKKESRGIIPVRLGQPIETLALDKLNPKIPTLFLDIDGVLHRNCNETLERKSDLINWLQDKECQIVITSNWRESYRLEDLATEFGEVLWARVVGFTPVLEYIEDIPTREREVTEFVNFYAISHFICIDDWREGFSEPPTVPIVFTEKKHAMTDRTFEELSAWYDKYSLKSAL